MALYERLSAQDRSFLDLETPECHMHVAGAFLLEAGPVSRPEGGVDIDRVRAYVESRLHLIPRYRQKVAWTPVEGHPAWVDDAQFNIHYHVRHTALPAPGDERQLKRLCGRILSQQLDRGKPLWEIWIVEGLAEDRVAMVTKVHHCMVDGISGMHLLQVLLRPTPEKTFEEAPTWVPNPTPSGFEMLRDAAWLRASRPLSLPGQMLRVLHEPEKVAEEVQDAATGVWQSVTAALKPASQTPFNRPIGPHRRFDWLAFDLDEVKRVKRSLGGTVNDVVLATVSGAVRQFLERRGVSPESSAGTEFRTFCPVSVRSASEEGALGNRVAGMFVPLPVTEPDPARRLATIRETTEGLKDSKQALGAEVLASVSEWTSTTLATVAARLAFRNGASNLVVTNVPGPQVPLYLLGSALLESYPMVPLFENLGLGIALFSYRGGLYWGFSCDWELMPDLHDFVIAIDASFRELCEAADERTPEGDPAP